MKKLAVFLLLPVFAGCLTAHVPATAEWNVVADVADTRSSKSAPFGVVRLTQVVVSPPYDDCAMNVYRSDNTLATDPYNLFAAIPSRLLREPARAVMAASGKFKSVLGSTSSANVSHIVELTVTDLRLDCSHDDEHPDRREAVAEVYALVLDANRDIVGSCRAASRADARDGNYGRAFSKAFSLALERALSDL